MHEEGGRWYLTPKHSTPGTRYASSQIAYPVGLTWAEAEQAAEAFDMETKKVWLQQHRNPKHRRNAATMYTTKPGKHGTLYLYEFKIKEYDPGSPAHYAPYGKQRAWGYDADHAFERMLQNLDFQGWEYRKDYDVIGDGHKVKAKA